MTTALRAQLRASTRATEDELDIFEIIADAALDLKYIAERVKFTSHPAALHRLKSEASERAAKLVTALNNTLRTGEG